MTQTFLTRLSYLEQYDIPNKIISWKDEAESRWNGGVFSKLKKDDNALFIMPKNKIAIGKVQSISKPLVICSDIIEIDCSNDQLLQLHEIYPELISLVKANFNPFIHSKEINISKLITDANDKRFLSYYLVATKATYESIKNSLPLQDNDRIILLDDKKQVGEIYLHSKEKLIDFSDDLHTGLGAKSLKLEDILKLNIMVKVGNPRSNNINRANSMIRAIIMLIK